ncbi:Lysine methyltransferase [Schizosaccharomyces pombe]|uniref:Uncharacterized protein C16C6.01c n=1 Tax=Schizosaccharomyces pombe (strain 972 / ATCC 24843) TaxID=284812 RepID=YBD1_SCHPO|nr:putative lysine methyltransferase [Schizosaccharomyces pombe]O42925.2 RecName: Full=Uncharacterized protein C16C6.01c [Schizosaccharomyces pombe 972h-]CAC05253.2 lysine methyltransferase (predicted) [Schizosaccharomyces pombe]|eukprot:NP_001342972.1 putative lysine methyltransferase [Schizosaccharomyces pombe]
MNNSKQFLKYQPLLEWLAKHEAYISPKLYIASSGVAGDGIFSTFDIDELEVLAKIPRRIILSPRNSRFGDSLYTHFNESNRSDDINFDNRDQVGLVMLVITVILENITDSPWNAYLNTLDETCMPDSPLLWKDKTCLEGTSMLDVINTNLRVYKNQYDQLVRPYFYKHADLKQLCPKWNQYLETCVLVQSRCFYVNSYYGLSLIPFFDIFNHKSGPAIASLHCQESNDHKGDIKIEFISFQYIRKMSEIFNSFGNFAADELFTQYGFIDTACKVWRVDMTMIAYETNRNFYMEWIHKKRIINTQELLVTPTTYANDKSETLRSVMIRQPMDLYIITDHGPSYGLYLYLFFCIYKIKFQKCDMNIVMLTKYFNEIWAVFIAHKEGEKEKVVAQLSGFSFYCKAIEFLQMLCQKRISRFKNGGLTAEAYKTLLCDPTLKRENRSRLVLQIFYHELNLLEKSMQETIYLCTENFED